MPSVRLLPASGFDTQRLAAAFNRAFEGYAVPIHQTPSALSALIVQTDVRLDRSLVLIAPDGTPAGLALLAARGARGWIAGMGIAPELRGQRYGGMLLAALLARAWEAGLRHIQLEALVENLPACHLYVRYGFRIVRHLAVFSGPLARARAAPTSDDLAITCAPMPVAEALTECAACQRPAVPWQREVATLTHMAPSLTAVALYEAGERQACLLTIASPAGQSVLDFCSRAAEGEHRRTHALRLLRHLAPGRAPVLMRAINIPEEDALAEALVSLRCPIAARQVEMALDLTSPPAEAHTHHSTTPAAHRSR